MKDVVLSVHNINAGYHSDKPILQNVSFDVKKGEMIGLIGANGAGKSTLLKTLRGVIKAKQGTIEIQGHLTDEMSERDFARAAAYLQQNVTVPFGYSAREIVMVGRYPMLHWWQHESADDEKIVDAAMEYTGVREFSQRPLHQLSGGQRQRVLLAKVLAQQTPLLFLDEPATGLDIFYQEEIFRFCRELCAVGKTVLMVVHELGLAAKFCSRLMLIGQGQILANGTADEVLTPEKLSLAYGVNVSVTKNPSSGFVEVTTVPPPRSEHEQELLSILLGDKKKDARVVQKKDERKSE